MMENRTTEFKREYTDNLKYTVIAFANTEGGKIYIGINDDTTVCGVDNTDEIMLSIGNMLRDSIRPDITMFTDCCVKTMQGKNVIVLTVQRGTARPYYLYSKGIRPEGVYVRQGASSVPASETAILSMIKETSGERYEEARALNQNLSFSSTEKHFKTENIIFGEAQMRTLCVINEDGTFSNLALLLSDQCIHTIKAAFFDGSDKMVFRDRKEFSGSVFQQLEETAAYIDHFNRTRAEIVGLVRVEERDYPPEALREALINSVIHRDYALSGPTLVSIFDDRIEILNLGGLVKGISYEDIMLGVSLQRNRHLANVFYRLKLIEAYGTGIRKINGCYADSSVKPKIEITEHAFKITLPNKNYVKEKNLLKVQEPSATYQIKYSEQKETFSLRENVVISLFNDRDTIGRKDVESALQISQATAILILRSMVNKGILVKENAGKYQKYRLGNKRAEE
ncbi:MAG: putative DNA binding domain-containing protein [Acidaminococcaceae bacterium]|nr:putative DNA binding domain-containing protein [Acidaminococcaceae bacterium]